MSEYDQMTHSILQRTFEAAYQLIERKIWVRAMMSKFKLNPGFNGNKVTPDLIVLYASPLGFYTT